MVQAGERTSGSRKWSVKELGITYSSPLELETERGGWGEKKKQSSAAGSRFKTG